MAPPRMTRKDGEDIKKRWAMVNAAQVEELRNTSIEEKFRQLGALMEQARRTERTEAEATEEAEVRERWRRLREAYRVRAKKTPTD